MLTGALTAVEGRFAAGFTAVFAAFFGGAAFFTVFAVFTGAFFVVTVFAAAFFTGAAFLAAVETVFLGDTGFFAVLGLIFVATFFTGAAVPAFLTVFAAVFVVVFFDKFDFFSTVFFDEVAGVFFTTDLLVTLVIFSP